MTAAATHLLVVDDHVLLGEGLAIALRDQGFDVTVAPDPFDVVALAGAERPDLILLDLDLGGGRDSTEFLPDLIAAGHRVIILSGVVDDYRLSETLVLGAEAVLSKATGLDDLVASIIRAARGSAMGRATRERMMSEYHHETQRRTAAHRPFDELTEREETVLAALMDGLDAAAIAERDYVSTATIRTQIRSVFTKLGVNSQLAAVAMAHRAGWQPRRPQRGIAC